jgi:hypothetical protein
MGSRSFPTEAIAHASHHALHVREQYSDIQHWDCCDATIQSSEGGIFY